MRRGYLNGGATHFAREVSVHRSGEVVDRGVLIEVSVHHQLEDLKLLQDSIDRRRADVGLALLDFLGDFIGRQMTGSAHEDFGDGSFGDRRPFGGAAYRRDDFVDLGGAFGHGQRLCPRIGERDDRQLEGVELGNDLFGLFDNRAHDVARRDN
jgi:hypothetical protein